MGVGYEKTGSGVLPVCVVVGFFLFGGVYSSQPLSTGGRFFLKPPNFLKPGAPEGRKGGRRSLWSWRGGRESRVSWVSAMSMRRARPRMEAPSMPLRTCWMCSFLTPT